MDEEEFASFLRYLTDNYANENVTAGRAKADAATDQAAREIEELLPDGRETGGHYFYTVRALEESVGAVWVSLREDGGERSVWIFDLVIDEAHRCNGYASQTLEAV